jgi:hypothetical protein
MYEWLPYNAEVLDQVPADPAQRRAWLRTARDGRFRAAADLYRDKLIEAYGEARGKQVIYAEAFEACEYGAPLTAAARARLFPFFG